MASRWRPPGRYRVRLTISIASNAAASPAPRLARVRAKAQSCALALSDDFGVRLSISEPTTRAAGALETGVHARQFLPRPFPPMGREKPPQCCGHFPASLASRGNWDKFVLVLCYSPVREHFNGGPNKPLFALKVLSPLMKTLAIGAFSIQFRTARFSAGTVPRRPSRISHLILMPKPIENLVAA